VVCGVDPTADKLDCADADALVAEIAAGTDRAEFDLTRDGFVDRADLDEWLALAVSENLPGEETYLYGDANLDQQVNLLDLDLLGLGFSGFESGWGWGDFNGSGDTDLLDLDILGLTFGFDANAPAAAAITTEAAHDAGAEGGLSPAPAYFTPQADATDALNVSIRPASSFWTT